MNEQESVVIIGSGPAGHTAAIYTGRAQLRPLMFEGFGRGGTPGGQLMITTEVENYPGFPDGIRGPDLMGAMRRQSERFGARILSQDVESVDFSVRPFAIVSEGRQYRARAVIVATGASARFLGIEGEQRLLNRGVSACATCDGALPVFRNQDLVVVGGGDSAMEEASYLTRFAKGVAIVHRRSELRASKIMGDRVRGNPKIELVLNTVVEEIMGQEQVTGVRLRQVLTGAISERAVAGVFMAIGHVPNTDFLKGQLRLSAKGYVETEPRSSRTSVAGVFAAGDVQDAVYRQAITAAGSGCQAALDAERWLAEHGS